MLSIKEHCRIRYPLVWPCGSQWLVMLSDVFRLIVG